MNLTEQERRQLEESKVLRDLLGLYLSISSSLERSLFAWSAAKTDLDERMIHLHLRRLRCEDTPDKEALAYTEAALRAREGWEEVNAWLREMTELTELFTRVVIDLRAGREPTVPHRVMTTIQVKFEKVVAELRERVELASREPSGEGGEEE